MRVHAHAHAHTHVHAHTDGMHPVRQMRLRHPLLTTILGTLAWLVSQAPHTGGGQIETVAAQIETVAARGSSGKQQHQQHQQQTILAAERRKCSNSSNAYSKFSLCYPQKHVSQPIILKSKKRGLDQNFKLFNPVVLHVFEECDSFNNYYNNSQCQ